MNQQQGTSPEREGSAADHDQPYTWGRTADTYLAPREVARIMIFRSKLTDRPALRQRQEHLARAA
jgi:hypothetical protein